MVDTTKTKQSNNNRNRIDRIPPEKRWQPGESGNPNGRPRNSVTTLLKNTSPEDNQAICDTIIAMAKKGDIQHIKEYLDRTEGKVTEKHLNVNITATPESLHEAQERLLNAQSGTKLLLEKYPKRITNATE